MKRDILAKIKKDEILLLFRKLLKDFPEVYLVGGAIRDFGFGVEPKEYDFVVKDPRKLVSFLSEKLKINFFKLGRNLEYVYRIPLGEGGADFSPIKGRTISADLKKRDFTIDSIAVNLHTFEVYDPCQGLKDLQQKVLRMTSSNAFCDDALRILKGYRLCSFFPELIWEEKTLSVAAKDGEKLKKIAKERIQAELSKILVSKNCANTLKEMTKNNILFIFFPFLAELKGLKQPYPHKSDVLTHIFDMLKFLDENIYLSQILSIKSHSEREILKLRLAIIFHDIGKKDSFSEDKKGIHFYGHEKISSKIAKENLSRLKFPTKITNEVARLCELHLRPLLLFKDKKVSETAKRRLIRESGEDFPLLMLLSFIDFSSMERTQREIEEYYYYCENMFSLYQDIGREIIIPPKLIDGLEAMDILGLKAKGQKLGNALKSLRQEQIDGKIKNRKEAVLFLKNYRKKFLDKK
ncbi:MAG: HD domain-containing protein [Acidobacteriota bacterium]